MLDTQHHRCVMHFAASGLSYGREIRLESGWDDGLEWKTAMCVPEGGKDAGKAKGKGKEKGAGAGTEIAFDPRSIDQRLVTYGNVPIASQRMSRILRANLRDYCRRNFCPPEEADPVKHACAQRVRD